MNNIINVGFNPRTKRLQMAVPFHLSDVARGFPSRRFEPKTKVWAIPLVAANIRHLTEIWSRYDFVMTEDAAQAVRNAETLTAAPKYIPFPSHVYDFTKSQAGFTPMKHQTKMLDHSYGLDAFAWFAKMGTGKTFAAVHMAFAQWRAGLIDAVMIICPSTLRPTWRKELAKYATGEYDFRIHETKAKWLSEFYARPPDPREPLPILAVSVEGLGVSTALYDSACGYMVGRRVFIILDESSRIKNPGAKRTQRAIELGRVAVKRGILNGTPIALGIQDLWSQYEFLDPNIIGSGDYWAFKTRYIVMGGYEQKQIVGVQNVDELMKLILPYTIEVGKDVLDLPPKVMMERLVEITSEQRALIKIIVKGPSGLPNEPEIKVTNSLEKILRCRQVVGGYLPRAIPHEKVIDGITQVVYETVIEPLKENPKLDSMLEMIEDNRHGTKFIVWTTFIHEIEHIRDVLAAKYGPASVECYYGKTAMEDRSRIEDRYCNDSSLRFFIGNPVAAGLGLTLISGETDLMVYYSGTNAYIDRAQSEDRSHRIGQARTVTVVDMVAEKTVDELIVASIRAKMDIEEYLMTRIAAGFSMDALLLGEGG